MRKARAIFLSAAALLLGPLTVVCAPSKLGQSYPVNKLVTPNGDGFNDTFVFRCYNPRDAAIDARIYDVSGREAGSMRLKSAGLSDFYYTYEWDPNSGGRSPGGVYIYQISVEKNVYKGTVVVIR